MQKNTLLFLYLAILPLVTLTIGVQGSEIKDESSAIITAFEYCGFDSADKSDLIKNASASFEECIADSILFINTSKSNSVEIWNVVFEKVAVKQLYSNNEIISVRDYEVRLNARTGNLIDILSISDDYGSPDTMKEASFPIKRDFISRRGYTYYETDEKPNLDFVSAISLCRWSLDMVKKIRAYAVNCTEINCSPDEPRIYWFMELRGTVPAMPYISSTNVPNRVQNSIISVIDDKAAKTKWLYSPPPPGPEEE